MKKSILLCSLVLVACAALLILGGNAKALDQLIIYLPFLSVSQKVNFENVK